MTMFEVTLGFGLGWSLYGIVQLIFSSKKLTKKLCPHMSAYEVEEDCRRYRLKAIAFLCFAVASFIAAYILKTL